jgi:hypothetical protein
MPAQVGWGTRRFRLRNQSSARVDYVLGEVYWKCEVGETTRTTDLIDGSDVLSREQSPGEVKWTHSTQLTWAVIAQAFGLPIDGPGGQLSTHTGGSGSSSGSGAALLTLIIVVVVLLFCVMGSFGSGSSSGYRGGGGVVFVGGK